MEKHQDPAHRAWPRLGAKERGDALAHALAAILPAILEEGLGNWRDPLERILADYDAAMLDLRREAEGASRG